MLKYFHVIKNIYAKRNSSYIFLREFKFILDFSNLQLPVIDPTILTHQ